ncbi:MAG: dihydropteroate synthase [Bacteroidetes bacterium]|nr:dihydropteroate synthase [Bacteroidota bacterium]
MICNGKILDLSTPAVMGILNLTPDSFFDGGMNTDNRWEHHVDAMIHEGADIIDIGGVSTRPGSLPVAEKEEISRLLQPFRKIRKNFPDAILSIDTYRSETARVLLEEGADMINDISGGTFDPLIFHTIRKYNVPVIIMHILGTPRNMQDNPEYKDVVKEVRQFLMEQAGKLINQGHTDIILDPGIGFGKSIRHNFELLENLDSITNTKFPVLVGISRKSMINKILGTTPETALNGTTVLNTIALLKGASILRVHDVKEARQTIRLVSALQDVKKGTPE